MKKRFNTTGTCIPERHYMVDISNKIEQIMEIIEYGEYFTINRPRQYGKTTTMFMLENYLKTRDDYFVLFISFEGIGDEVFRNEEKFVNSFIRQIKKEFVLAKEEKFKSFIENYINIITIEELSTFITELCMLEDKKIVIMIDEVDKSSNNQLFLSFIGMLRNKYLARDMKKDFTFQSVILAGVYDVKSLKLKLRPGEEEKYNSPWNIAIDFDLDMSFNPQEIATMLRDYSLDRDVKMDIEELSKRIHYYTSGYPFLVSKICQIIDEKMRPDKEWTLAEIDESVKILIKSYTVNFDSLIKNLENTPNLYKIVYEIVMEGDEKSFNLFNPDINLGVIYGILDKKGEILGIHNKIYEQIIYDYMSSKIETSISTGGYNFRDNFINSDNSLDFSKILMKFQEFMKVEYSQRDKEFIEKNGRLVFLAFLKPIINGKGFDFKEVQISEEKRLDVVVTYLNFKYVVEMKIWYGEEAHQKGIQQLNDYLDRQNLDKGYLIIFNKNKKKEWKQDRIEKKGKDIFCVWV